MPPLFIDNDNVVTITAMRDAVTGEIIEDADVTAKVVNALTGEDVGSSVECAPVDGEPGTYKGTVEDATPLIEDGTPYYVDVVAVSATLRGHWKIQTAAEVRQE